MHPNSDLYLKVDINNDEREDVKVLGTGVHRKINKDWIFQGIAPGCNHPWMWSRLRCDCDMEQFDCGKPTDYLSTIFTLDNTRGTGYVTGEYTLVNMLLVYLYTNMCTYRKCSILKFVQICGTYVFLSNSRCLLY